MMLAIMITTLPANGRNMLQKWLWVLEGVLIILKVVEGGGKR